MFFLYLAEEPEVFFSLVLISGIAGADLIATWVNRAAVKIAAKATPIFHKAIPPIVAKAANSPL